jgi:hypothetical protein
MQCVHWGKYRQIAQESVLGNTGLLLSASKEVRWEVGAGEGGDLTAHAHSAYSYIKHTVSPAVECIVL